MRKETIKRSATQEGLEKDCLITLLLKPFALNVLAHRVSIFQYRFNANCQALLLFICVVPSMLLAQFPGPVGTPGTTAIHKDSTIFVGWASACEVNRGYMDIADPSFGHVSAGHDTLALGLAESIGVVSLGDGGSAVLTFPTPITDGAGFDFAVFENAFSDSFLELAFVEVSSDGVHFFRFPASSNTQTITQIGAFDDIGDATKLHNLAGKYRANYGTPFDLQELNGIAGLNIHAITHIKIIDIIGTISHMYASFDANGNPINDPYPTAFASGGFDLDAIGVIHQQPASIDVPSASSSISIAPNPLQYGQSLHINAPFNIETIVVYNSLGVSIFEGDKKEFASFDLSPGMYFIHISTQKSFAIKKLLVTD